MGTIALKSGGMLPLCTVLLGLFYVGGCAAGVGAEPELAGAGNDVGSGVTDGNAAGASGMPSGTNSGTTSGGTTPPAAGTDPTSNGADPVAGNGEAGAGSDITSDDGSAGSSGARDGDGSSNGPTDATDGAGMGGAAAPAPTDPCALDADGDSIGDCDEADDGDDWTDPQVFNGVHVQTRNQSNNDITCGMIDTLGEVLDAVRGSVQQELDQYSGWDFDDADDNRTSAGYGFQPPWTDSDSSWQIDAVGHIRLESGTHCFEVAGEVDESCGTLFLSPTPSTGTGDWASLDAGTAATAQHGGGVTCIQLDAGTYPIRWHYEMDNGRGAQSMHLRYCHDASADCTPSEAIPARILRVTP